MNFKLACTLLAFAAPLASAQWSSDTTANLVVSDAAADQVQPMIAPTSDGGCYISWLDSIANGFDVRLQRLDAAGNELWPHDGVLVIDRGFSSTQSYGLDVDAAGNALLAARDDGGSGVQITASKVSPTGTLLWGPGGVTLTNTSAFVSSPKIAGTADVSVVVAWGEDPAVKLQRLDASGVPIWGTDITMTPPAGFYFVGDLHDAGTDTILSMVHQTGAMFWSPKHLVAQKFDAAGAPLWGSSPVSVFDSGSLQIGNYPPFKHDGSGGAVFAWYGTSPLQCYAQHILSNGVEAFPHNGVSGSTNGAQVRVDPSVDYDAATGSTYLFWTEQSSGQSQCGLSGQKFDSAGVRQWSAQGTMLIPVSSPEIRQVKTQVSGAGAFVFWTHIPSFGNNTLHGAHVDASGAYDNGPFEVSSVPSVKSRLDAEIGATGQVLLAWSDQRTDGGDILAQNINPDGSLGSSEPGAPYCFGVGCPCGNDDALAGCANDTGSGASLGASGSASTSADSLVLSASGLTVGPGLFFQGNNAVNSGAGNPFGDGLRCAGGNVVRLEVQFANAGNGFQAQSSISISSKGGVSAGQTKRYQYWYRDSGSSPCGSLFNLSNGYELVWQP
jgi:hypothetical protein